MDKARVKGRSVRRLILLPILAISLAIAIVFVGLIAFSGALQGMNRFAAETLNKQVAGQAQSLEESLLAASDCTAETAGKLALEMESLREEYAGFGGVHTMLKDSPDALERSLGIALARLKMLTARASGAFIVLDVEQSGSSLTSLYIKNNAGTGQISGSSEDLILLQGPRALLEGNGLQPDRNWRLGWAVNPGEPSEEVFTQPMKAAADFPELNLAELGYWSDFYVVNDSGQRVMTYTVPLLDETGLAYGVIGVEFSEAYMQQVLSQNGGLSMEQGVLLFGNRDLLHEADSRLEVGALAEQLLSSYGGYNIYDGAYGDLIFPLRGGKEASRDAYGAYRQIHLYYLGSPFYGDTFVLYGIVPEDALFAQSQNLTTHLSMAAIIALLIGIAGAIVISQFFSHSLKRVVRNSLSASGASGVIDLGRTGIREIDLLVATVEALSEDVLEFSKRTMETIKLTDMPIGVFEIVREANTVYMNKVVAELCGVECEEEETFISLSQWEPLINRLKSSRERGNENIYVYNAMGKDTRWLKIKTAQKGSKEYGIIMDVTSDILEKMHLELERDIDSLTGLFNRNAFMVQAQAMVDEEPDKLGALLYADIDNLKRINDLYGFDTGNNHIFAVAEVFRRLSHYGGVAGRINGDAFALYLHGYDSEDALRSVIHKIVTTEIPNKANMTGGRDGGISCSVAFTLYPLHSSSLDQLMRYVDYAMNEMKKSGRISVREFDPGSYASDMGQAHKEEVLTTFIENNTVGYLFQPIVSVNTGKVFGYEELMRPHIDELHTPLDVLELAKKQAKLYQIERMTYFNTLAWMKDNAYFLGDRKMFINSIPSMLLSTRDMQELRDKYEPYLPSIVTELSETELSDDEFINTKVGSMRKWRSAIAIDRFTDSVSSDMLVMSTKPEFIKICEEITHNIHLNKKNQQVVLGIVQKSRHINAQVIACSVESREEMEALILLGVDYLQGYYLGEPMAYLEDVPKALTDSILHLKQQRNNLQA